MLDFHSQAISATFTMSTRPDMSDRDLMHVLCMSLRAIGETVRLARVNSLGGATVTFDGGNLFGVWQDRQDDVAVLTLSISGGLDGDMQRLERYLARLLRPLLRALPVCTVGWRQNRVELPADEVRRTLQAVVEPLRTLRVLPRRVNRGAAAAPRERLDRKSAAQRIAAIENHHALRLTIPRAVPRRVQQQSTPSAVRRLSADAARAIVSLVPQVGHAAGINPEPLIRVQQHDAHVMAYQQHLRDEILRDASSAELHRMASEQSVIPVEARLSTWAVSITVATISLPMALPVIAWNLMRGENFRAAALVLGLSGPMMQLSGSPALAAMLAGF